MRRKTNKTQAPMTTYLVGDGNQSLVASGDVVGSGSSLNIAESQLGVVSADHDGTVKPGAFIPAGTLASDVNAVQIIQGTPYSSQTTLVSAFGHTHKAKVESGILRAGKIRSVSTDLPALPQYQMIYLRSVSGLALSTTSPDYTSRYHLKMTIEGQRNDIVFGMNREVISSVMEMPTSAPTNSADLVLQSLALELNKQSLYVGQASPANFAGNKPFVVFGVKSSGGSGTTIGTITKSTSAFNFAKYTLADGSTVQATYKPTINFVNSLNKAIGTVAGLSTAKIENLGNVTPGSASTIDGLLIVVFHNDVLPAFDNVPEMALRAQVGFGTQIGETQPTFTQTEVTTAYEGRNRGRQVMLNYKSRAGLQVFNMQNHPIYSEYFVEAPNYLDEDLDYTLTVIDFYDDMEVLNNDPTFEKKVVIALTASLEDDTNDADTGYSYATDDTTTVTSLNNTLGAWLEDAESYGRIEYKGDAVIGDPFV